MEDICKAILEIDSKIELEIALNDYIKYLLSLDEVQIYKEIARLYSNLGYYAEVKSKFIIIYSNKTKEKIRELLLVENSKVLNYTDCLNILKEFEGLSNLYKNYNYRLISLRGYSDYNEILKLENYNLCIDNEEYIKRLLDRKSLIYSDYIDLLAHNRVTYRNIVDILNHSSRVCAIQATGTGKSFLAGRCCLDYKDENKIIVSSSYYILNQFTENFDFLNDKTKLIHYASLSKMTDEDFKELLNFNPKLIVLDEFHRAGAEEWYKGVDMLLSKFDCKVLGTSATPIRFLDNKRNMSQELFEGNVANEINLFDAIIKKILPMPKYVQSYFEIDAEVENIKNNLNKSNISKERKENISQLVSKLVSKFSGELEASIILNKHITNERKFVVFCKDSTHINEMIPVVKDWFKNAFPETKINIFKVLSSFNESSSNLNEFIRKEKDLSEFNLLFAVDKMNEGVHAPSVEGLILLRPTVSPIIYYQQLGRCLQSNKNVVPIIFDFVNNANNIQTVTFKQNLEKAFSKSKSNRKSNGLDTSNEQLDELYFNIYDETVDILEILKEIQENITYTWDKYFLKLKSYYETYNTTVVEKNSGYDNLYTWCLNQRALYNAGSLSEERIEKLNSIEFSWNLFEDKWDKEFEKLKDFKNKNNTTIIPNDYEDKKFSTWVITQRCLKKQGKLSEKRVELLNSIDFIWDVDIYKWELQFKNAYEFYIKNGHFSVPRYGETISLAKWIQTQRTLYKKNELSDFKIKKLESINFPWDALEQKWFLMYNTLFDFYNEFGHCHVKVSYENKSLYKWVIRQRVEYNKGLLPEKRISLLNNINFQWTIYDSDWLEKYDKLKELYSLNKEIPKELSSWISKQRKLYKDNKLEEYKIQKLNEIDFIWDVLEHKWNKMLEELKLFKEKHGHIKVSSKGGYSSLYNWLKQQRREFMSNRLSKERYIKLNLIDKNWI